MFCLRTFLRISALLAITLSWWPLQAQDYEFDEDSRLNTNLGFPVTVPVGETSKFSNLGTGFVAGAGYNFNQHNAFVGEFMWNWLYPTEESLAPLRAASGLNSLTGHGNLFTFTGNYRLEMRSRKFGTYLIGGAGIYYRNASLSSGISVPPATPCTDVFLWWGFPCPNGIVSNKTQSSFSSASIGGNAGIGFTVKVGEPRYRLYVEARYHYVPYSNLIARFVPITTGIRF